MERVRCATFHYLWCHSRWLQFETKGTGYRPAEVVKFGTRGVHLHVGMARPCGRRRLARGDIATLLGIL